MLESRHCGPCCRSGEIGRRKGLKILSRGIAQVVDDMGNPLCLCGLQPLVFLFLFVALCLHSPWFVQPANTVITPAMIGTPPPAGVSVGLPLLALHHGDKNRGRSPLFKVSLQIWFPQLSIHWYVPMGQPWKYHNTADRLGSSCKSDCPIYQPADGYQTGGFVYCLQSTLFGQYRRSCRFGFPTYLTIRSFRLGGYGGGCNE